MVTKEQYDKTIVNFKNNIEQLGTKMEILDRIN